MSDLPPPSLPQGWYTDPENNDRQRFWDGKSWTDKTIPRPAPAVSPDSTPSDSKSDPAPAAPKPVPGCGTGCLVVVGVIVVIGIIIGIGSAITGGDHTDSGGGDDTDPIHQATAVLTEKYGDSVTYEEVKAVTDSALAASGNPVDDGYRSKAWSSVLSVIDGQDELASVDPMDVMRCAGDGNGGSGVELPQLIAVCAVSLK